MTDELIGRSATLEAQKRLAVTSPVITGVGFIQAGVSGLKKHGEFSVNEIGSTRISMCLLIIPIPGNFNEDSLHLVADSLSESEKNQRRLIIVLSN
jgi:hypothetical protein